MTEGNMRDGLGLVEQALLEADVSFSVVRDFMARVSEQAVGEQVLKSLDPSQQLVGIVNQELIRAARHKTAREIRELLADRRPRPDVPSSVRRIPPATPASVPLAPAAAGGPTVPAASPREMPKENAADREGVEPRPAIAASPGPAPGAAMPPATRPSSFSRNHPKPASCWTGIE